MSEEREPALAAAALPRDLAVLKMENETIVAMAAAAPRDYVKILEDLKGQLKAYPTFAAAAMYCKPVGKNQAGEMQYAEDLSIRAAEALAEAYGFNRVSTYVDAIEDDEDKLRISASFTDYQRGRIWSDSVVVSAWYRTKHGKMKRHGEDRFLNVVVKAERSKLVREVILRSVPAGLKSELKAIAGRLQEQGLDDVVIEKILAAWEGKGVSLEELEQVIGKTRANWTVADRKRLLHLWQAVQDGETTIGQVLERDEPEKKKEPTVEETGDGKEDLFGAGVNGRDEPWPEPKLKGKAEDLTDEERAQLEAAVVGKIEKEKAQEEAAAALKAKLGGGSVTQQEADDIMSGKDEK